MQQRGELVRRKFGTEETFLQKVNPDTQKYFGKHPDIAVMGDYPTLTDINIAYGNGFAEDWLLPQLVNISKHVGARNMNTEQLTELAGLIATEYRHFKITELLFFFYRFKTGRYGRFYGTIDPMVIMCALREFSDERYVMIDRIEHEMADRREKEENAVRKTKSYEEYLQTKSLSR